MSLTTNIETAARKIENLTETLKWIETVACRKVASDDEDFNAMDWSGGNFDDAYALGCQDGEIMFAGTILAKLKGDKQ